jgi:hypothetical protein
MKLLYPIIACILFTILFVISKIKYSNSLLSSHWDDTTSYVEVWRSISKFCLYALLASVLWFVFSYGMKLNL